MKYDFDKLIDRSGTYACKTDELPAGCPDDALPAWVADMDLPCAEPVLQAIKERADHPILGYTLYTDEAKQPAVDWYKHRFGWEIDPKTMFFSPGVVPALGLLIEALTEPDDGIVIQKPVYYPFMAKIEANGRRIVNNPLIRRETPEYEGEFDYVMNYDQLDELMADPANKGMILCSPHNPVGRVWSREELSKVVEICRKHNKWIIADEIHCDLTRREVIHTPLLKLTAEIAPDFCDRIISCTAPSKTFNLAGLSFSNIIIPGEVFRKQWLQVASNQFSLVFGCNPLSLAGVMAAYREGEDWLEQLKDYLDGNIEYIGQFVRDHMPEAKTAVCQGTYLFWLDLTGYCRLADGNVDVKKLEYAMQQVGRVALDEGYIFGREGAGYERINVAMPRALVEDCRKRIKKACDWLKAEAEAKNE